MFLKFAHLLYLVVGLSTVCMLGLWAEDDDATSEKAAAACLNAWCVKTLDSDFWPRRRWRIDC